MKKIILTLLFACGAYIYVSAQDFIPHGERIYLTACMISPIIDPTYPGPNYPKSPVQPPEVYLDGYTLYIVSSHADYTLVVEDTDETEVYQTSVPSSVSTVVLPSSLSGTYILKLETDTFIFEGEIEL